MTGRTLVLLAHADPSVRPLYESACGPGVSVRPFVAGSEYGKGLSEPYKRMAAALRKGGRIIPSLLAKYAADAPAHDKIVLAWWSGGYALAREVLASEEERDVLDGCVALDGGHASEEADGTPLDAQVQSFANYAKLAREGKKVFLYGHSTVDPVSYASTTEVGQEIAKLAGQPERGFSIRKFDKLPGEAPKDEHVRALRQWGPVLVADACERLRERTWWEVLTDNIDRITALPARLGEALRVEDGVGAIALEIARLEAATVREKTGNNDGAVEKYFIDGPEGAGPTVRRNPMTGPKGSPELPTGWTSGWEWCASSSTFCVALAAKRAKQPTKIVRRIAVWEIARDARENGTMMAKLEAPKLGYLAIWKRSGQNPMIPGGTGHVSLVETLPDANGNFRDLNGNAGTAWGYRDRNVNDPDLLCWIAT